MKRLLFLLFILIANATISYAQHEHHHTPATKDSGRNRTSKKDISDGKTDSAHLMPMSHAFSLHLPMTRNGSGTSWLPDESPMYGQMFHGRKWMTMLHYNFFLRYNNQDFTNRGSRGDSKIDAPNWVMFMGQRKSGNKGLFHFSTMLSLDPLTVGGSGYPLLYQSGETWEGKPLVDRQHPHDLFSELSVSYAHAFSKKTDVFLYLGYPGEPALGPVAFMHRPSALYNPDAPLSHHWLDATHITFGVATAGVRVGKFKLEASSFTGREPDENRYDFDKPRFDSWSGRISFNPGKNWAMQVSHGFLKNPETLHPGNVNRTTASINHSISLKQNSSLNSILAWGMNKKADHKSENALMLESSWRKARLAVYGRYEVVQKSVEELNLDETIYGENKLFPVNSFTAGLAYDIVQLQKISFSVGGQLSVYHSPQELQSLYGNNPLATEIYIRIYPSRMPVPAFGR